nr:transposase [Candidatus Accumulibacter cognatus]
MLATLRPTLPITAVLDKARHQRCAWVQACAEKLKIEWLCLPTYSPNLNLIERCLQDTHTIYAKALKSLFSLNFQTLPKANVLTSGRCAIAHRAACRGKV